MGRDKAVQGSNRDITEQTRAGLSRTDEMEMLLNHMDTMVLCLTNPETLSFVNRKTADFFNKERQDMAGASIYDTFPGKQAELFYRRNKKVFSSKKIIKAKDWMTNSSGERRLLASTLIPSLGADGMVESVIITSHDLTEEVRAKHRLQESHDKLSFLIEELNKVNKKLFESQKMFKVNFEESNIGMIIEDLKGNYTRVNSSLTRMLGYSSKELKNKTFYDITHPDDIAMSEELFARLLKGEMQTVNFEKRFIHKDGITVWVNINQALVRDEDEPVYLLNHVENINDKKEAEAKIIKQKQEIEHNKLKSRFFANLSHELRTPLNLILSTLQVLEVHKNKVLHDDQKFTRYVRLIKQNSFRLLRLVNNMIDINKINANSFQLNMSNNDIVDIVRLIVQSTEEYVINNKRVLRMKSSLAEKVIACDLFNIERILLNLISNAVKFTGEGDEISVEISEDRDWVVIKVSDTGIGIKPEDKQSIFQEFRQVDNSFTRSREGSGLGLSIVKSLVEMHNGQISVESEYGKGSDFIIKLPDRKLTEEEKQVYSQEKNLDRVEIEFSDIYSLN